MNKIDLFLTHLQSEDLASGTIANYGGNLRMFERWVTDQAKTIPTLTPADMKQYKAELKERYKPHTVNTKLACTSKLLQWCLENGHISDNPMAKIKAVPIEKYTRWLTSDQTAILLEANEQAIQEAQAKELIFSINLAIRTKAVTIFLLNTGLRASELCNLRLSDVNNGVVTVRWGKGSKRREVPLNGQAKSAIEDWLKVRRSGGQYLFTTRRQNQLRRYLLFSHLSELGKRLGFRLTPHVLRHTFGKTLADKGIALDRIAKLMGHSNVNTTAIYTMPGMEDLRQAVGLLD